MLLDSFYQLKRAVSGLKKGFNVCQQLLRPNFRKMLCHIIEGEEQRFLQTQRAKRISSMTVVSNCSPPDVLGLQLPEAFTTTSAGQDFWELKAKNIWRAAVRHHCSMMSLTRDSISWSFFKTIVSPQIGIVT